MSKASNFAMFIFGAGVGSVVTWLCVKKKYEQIAQEEIDSVKAVFAKREPYKYEDADTSEKEKIIKDKPNIIEYAAKVRDSGYTNYSNVGIEDIKEEKTDIMDKPYVIAPEEFGEKDGHETISLTYYADKILADDNDDEIDDMEKIIGSESLNTFGEYEDDSVFVRNDRLKVDYEILLDQRKYSDVIKKMPYKARE